MTTAQVVSSRFGRAWALLAAAGTALAATMIAGAPMASASTPPMVISATPAHLCAGPASWCPDVIASLPAGAQVQVICSRVSSYYVENLARRASEGFVAKSDIRNAPGGLADCDTKAHPAIYAAANALGWMKQNHEAGACLQFVQDAWTGAGKPIPNAADPIHWWNKFSLSYGTKARATSGNSRYRTPPRGALVFWGPKTGSPVGHVAISMGNGSLVSTEEGSTPGNAVHLLTISHRNSDGYAGVYLGWVMPIPGYQIQP